MAKRKKNAAEASAPDPSPSPEPEPETRSVEAGGRRVAMRAPAGTSQVGVPLDEDEVLVVKVPQDGVVRVSSGVAAKLAQHGFKQIEE